MMVHTLELADAAQLGFAFEELLAHEYVRDCAIELDSLCIRFVAPEDRAGKLIERIATHGGLRTAAREWVETEGFLTRVPASRAKEW
jgi:hypothetical protein